MRGTPPHSRTVINLPWLQRFAGPRQLVTGRKYGDVGASVHFHRIEAKRGEHADLGHAYDRASGQHHVAGADVLGDLTDVGAGPRGHVDAYRRSDARSAPRILLVGLLEGDDGVGALGDGRTSHDAHGLPRPHGAFEDSAGRQPPDHTQRARRRVRGSLGVSGADGVAVHGRVGEGRDVDASDHVCGQNLAYRVE
jgi:hypothetical protein